MKKAMFLIGFICFSIVSIFQLEGNTPMFFRKVKNINSKEQYFNPGTSNLMSGVYLAAIADFNEAIILDPNYAEAFTNLGIAEVSLGDVD